MYIGFGKNKVSFKMPKDGKNKREIGIYKIRDNYVIIAYSQKGKSTKYTGKISIRLPTTAKEYKDGAFGIGGR